MHYTYGETNKAYGEMVMMKKHVKITQKMISSFLMVAFMVVVVGGFSLRDMNTMNEHSLEMQDEMLGAVSQMKDMKINLGSAMLHLSNMLGAEVENEIEKYQELIHDELSQNEVLLDHLSLYEMSEDEYSIYQNILEKNEYFMTQINHMTNEITIYTVDSYSGKYSIIRSLKEDLEKQIDKLISFNEEQVIVISNMNEEIFRNARIRMLVLTIIGILISLVLGMFLSTWIARRLRRVSSFAEELGEGIFTDQLKIVKNDEIGMVGMSLNNATEKMRGLIRGVIHEIHEMSASSQELSATTEELLEGMEKIKYVTGGITAGAEEMSQSTKDAKEVTDGLVGMTEHFLQQAKEQDATSKEIQIRAKKIRENGTLSVEKAEQMYKENYQKMSNAIEMAKVVNEIKGITNSISEIAEQTELLSLNASIEAARAGAAGRGFAVVAEEIRKLSVESTTAVKDINQIILQVDDAIRNLTTSSNAMLIYLRDQVNPDYQNFVVVGEQYEEDSNALKIMAAKITDLSSQMSREIEKVGRSIDQITSTAEEAANDTETIFEQISQSLIGINEVVQATKSGAEQAEKLGQMTSQFSV